MKFKGRFVIVAVVSLLVITARMYGSLYYNYPLFNFPFIGIVSVTTAWWLGEKYDKVKFLSEKDVLTKIYNRRYIIEIFPKILASVKRNNENLSLFFLDVDKFKVINDTYGHEVGDRVLQHIASVLIKNKRNNEIIARWAGDEFLIIAHGINEKGTDLVIKRIQNELKESVGEINRNISVSIGCSVYPNDGENLDALFKVADQNMYKVKSQQKEHYHI